MKIALMTNFQEFTPGYSLTGIVKDQAEMLAKYGHEVHLFVNDQYNGEKFSDDVILEKKIPFSHLKDYRTIKDLTPDHKMLINTTAEILRRELADYDFAYTHDFVFTGWNLPYGMACKEASPDLPNLRWLHWIHSVPSAGSDWWDIKSFGPHHRLVFPNATDRIRVAEQYKGMMDDVRIIPHIKDIRTWFDFSEETRKFIDHYPAVLNADIVQVYPASVDRLEAKRVREVILIFSKLKTMGVSVCLVIANQWATGTQQKQDVEKYKKIAARNGLINGEEFIFTSDFEAPKYDVGIPKHMVRELLQCSNLFIFPTREESFGLVVPEAALSGGVLLVLNSSLPAQLEISGHTALYFTFGSFCNEVKHENEESFLRDVGIIILGRMQQDESILAKTFVRQHYNMDYLYHRVYAPIMAEASLWV
jgi:glycosyltransferase involved in cell wall biosynthesis